MTVEQLNVIVSANKTDFDNKIRAVKNELSTMQAKAQSASSGMLTAFKGLAAGLTALGIANFFKDANQSYITQMENELKLATVMKQRMGVTEEEISQVKELASAQQKLGIIGDEVQLAGAQQIATFATESDTIKTLIPAMNNLLAQQKGYNATASDAVSIGNLMGKVLQGQTSALTRVGITFTEAQENVLKYGTEEQRAAMLAQVITDNVGEMNEALRNTPTGQMTALKNDIGDVKEQIGATLQPLISSVVPIVSQLLTSTAPIIGELSKVMSGLASGITDIATRLENATPAQKTALKIALGMAVAIPAVTAATRLLTAAKAGYSAVMSFLIPKQLTFASALKATMGWIGLIVGALALIGIFNNDTAESTEDISDKLKSENDAAKKASEGIDKAAESTDNLTNAVKRSTAKFDELNKLGGSGTVASGIVSDEDVANADEYADVLSDVQSTIDSLNPNDINIGLDFDLSKIFKKISSGELGRQLLHSLATAVTGVTDTEVIDTALQNMFGDMFNGNWESFWENYESGWKDVSNWLEQSFGIDDSVSKGFSDFLKDVFSGGWDNFWKNWEFGYRTLADEMKKTIGASINILSGDSTLGIAISNFWYDLITMNAIGIQKAWSDGMSDIFNGGVKFFNGLVADFLGYKDEGEGSTTHISSSGRTHGGSSGKFSATGSSFEIINPYQSIIDLAKKQINNYASGGFPDYGSLFIANEAGPELVGTLGGRTAVVNNSQIENALYNAMRSAISEGQMSQQGGDIRVTLEVDGEVLAEVVERQNRIRNKRFNGR